MLSHTGLGAHPGGTVQLGALDQGIPLMSSSASLKQDNTGTCLRVLLRFRELSHSKYSMKGSCSLLMTVMIWEAAGSQAYSALAVEGGDFPGSHALSLYSGTLPKQVLTQGEQTHT